MADAEVKVKKDQPAQLTKPTRFLLAKADFFKEGITYKKGTIYTLGVGERPSRTWVEVDDNGNAVKAQVKASDHPVHPPKYQGAQLPPMGTESPKASEKADAKSDEKKGRTSDKTPL